MRAAPADPAIIVTSTVPAAVTQRVLVAVPAREGDAPVAAPPTAGPVRAPDGSLPAVGVPGGVLPRTGSSAATLRLAVIALASIDLGLLLTLHARRRARALGPPGDPALVLA